MHRAFRHSELLCRLTDRGAVFHNIIADLDGALLNI